MFNWKIFIEKIFLNAGSKYYKAKCYKIIYKFYKYLILKNNFINFKQYLSKLLDNILYKII